MFSALVCKRFLRLLLLGWKKHKLSTIRDQWIRCSYASGSRFERLLHYLYEDKILVQWTALNNGDDPVAVERRKPIAEQKAVPLFEEEFPMISQRSKFLRDNLLQLLRDNWKRIDERYEFLQKELSVPHIIFTN
jgi:hypothetical protein